MEPQERELTWEEFIDLDVQYAEPKASSHEESAQLWSMMCKRNPGEWKFFIVGPSKPEGENTFLMSSVQEERREIRLAFVKP